jgi:hypothetical protein
MSTKKMIEKKSKQPVKQATHEKKEAEKSEEKKLANILPPPAELTAADKRRERFLAARRNDSTLVIRIASSILIHLSELGWKKGPKFGAGTIAREVLEDWYSKECEKENNQTDGKK